MWKWLDSVGEFAVSNARVIKDAWSAFVVWCLIITAVAWWVMGQVYEVRLANSQSTVSSLTAQLSGAHSDIQDLRAQLAARPDRPDRWMLTYPDILPEQFKSLAERLKNTVPAGASIQILYVDNPSAVRMGIKFHKAFKAASISDTSYQTTDDDPKGFGISVFINDAKNPTEAEQKYIDAFRLGDFVVKVQDFQEELPLGLAFVLFISYPQ